MEVKLTDYYSPKGSLKAFTTKGQVGVPKRVKHQLSVDEQKINEAGENSELAKVHFATVKLKNKGKKFSDGGFGTGFVISSDGLIVTCKHVASKKFSDKVDDLQMIAYFPPGPNASLKSLKEFYNSNGHFFTTPVKILYKSVIENEDIAILKAPELKDSYDFLKITDEAPQVGEPVYTLGYPSREEKVSYGRVFVSSVIPKLTKEEANRRLFTEASFFEVIKNMHQHFYALFVSKHQKGKIISNNNVSGGNSGSPLCKENLEVCGVIDSTVENKMFIRGSLKSISNHIPNGEHIKHLTFSTPLIPVFQFLEQLGVNIQKLLDGEPSGLK